MMPAGAGASATASSLAGSSAGASSVFFGLDVLHSEQPQPPPARQRQPPASGLGGGLDDLLGLDHDTLALCAAHCQW